VEYAPPGYLLFVREQTLVAQRFDAAAGKLSGDPMPVAEGLGIDSVGLADFSVSRSGTLAYRVGRAGLSQYLWLDLRGNRGETVAEPGAINNFDLSPDGRWMVYQLGTVASSDLWVRDLKRGVSSRFTFDDGGEALPLFTLDNRFVVYERVENGKPNRILQRALDRTGTERVLMESPDRLVPQCFAPDGKTLIVQRQAAAAPWSLWQLPLGHPEQATAVVTSNFYNVRAAVSPDGRWLAFESGESGESEIYVVGFAGASGRWQISTRGGQEPAWSPNGKELYYLSPESRMMKVAVTTGSSFDAGVPEAAFVSQIAMTAIRNHYRLTPDGQRFLVITPQGDQSKPPTTILLNWTSLLQR
jgi:Tol biopolymer transport system component